MVASAHTLFRSARIGKRGTTALLVLFAVLFAGLWWAGFGQPQPPGAKETVPDAALLEGFDRLSPTERWLRISRTVAAAKECASVVRGDLVKTLVARGSLESARPGNVICKVRAPKSSTTAAVIKWLAEAARRSRRASL